MGPAPLTATPKAPLARAAGSAAVVVTEHLPRVERLWKRALVKRVSYSFVDRVLTVSRSNLAHLVERHGVPGGVIIHVDRRGPRPGSQSQYEQ